MITMQFQSISEQCYTHCGLSTSKRAQILRYLQLECVQMCEPRSYVGSMNEWIYLWWIECYARSWATLGSIYLYTGSTAEHAKVPCWLRCVPILLNVPRASTPRFLPYRSSYSSKGVPPYSTSYERESSTIWQHCQIVISSSWLSIKTYREW